MESTPRRTGSGQHSRRRGPDRSSLPMRHSRSLTSRAPPATRTLHECGPSAGPRPEKRARSTRLPTGPPAQRGAVGGRAARRARRARGGLGWGGRGLARGDLDDRLWRKARLGTGGRGQHGDPHLIVRVRRHQRVAAGRVARPASTRRKAHAPALGRARPDSPAPHGLLRGRTGHELVGHRGIPVQRADRVGHVRHDRAERLSPAAEIPHVHGPHVCGGDERRAQRAAAHL